VEVRGGRCGTRTKAGTLSRAQGGRKGITLGVGRMGYACRLGSWVVWAKFLEKNSFGFKLKFGFLPRHWKIAQKDLGGIWRWEFFLNSSRLSKVFRKNTIYLAMECIIGKINLGKYFYMQC
jgi:hypothetical protein